MAVSYASNAESLKVRNGLQRSTSALSRAFERLSSGLRINSAADDPAGLILADTLRNQAALMSVAIRNANDGLSLTAIADGGLGEISNMLTRMAELANQSSNSTYTTAQRSALELEFFALGSEIERISRTTEFNGIRLLTQTSTVTLQVGIDATANSQIAVNTVNTTLQALGIGNGSGALTFSLNSISVAGAVNASQNALTAVNSALNTVNTARGTVGASESRISSAINYLTVVRENYVAAESRIRDADVAEEVAEMVRLQVLQQAQTAVLAQANQQPGVALRLLE
jgi:flagellin